MKLLLHTFSSFFNEKQTCWILGLNKCLSISFWCAVFTALTVNSALIKHRLSAALSGCLFKALLFKAFTGTEYYIKLLHERKQVYRVPYGGDSKTFFFFSVVDKNGSSQLEQKKGCHAGTRKEHWFCFWLLNMLLMLNSERCWIACFPFPFSL